MKNYISVILLILFSIHSFAQIDIGRNLQDNFLIFNTKRMLDSKGENIDLTLVKGSPYLNKNFENGFVIMHKTNDTLPLNMRYNIFADEMEVTLEEKINLSSVQKRNDISIKLREKDFYYYEGQGYFEVLLKGKYNLLLKYHSVFVEEEPGKTPMHQSKPAMFKVKNNFFMEKDGILTEIPSSNKGFYELLNHQKEKLKEYIKEHQFSISNQQDLIKIILFYNSL